MSLKSKIPNELILSVNNLVNNGFTRGEICQRLNITRNCVDIICKEILGVMPNYRRGIATGDKKVKKSHVLHILKNASVPLCMDAIVSGIGIKNYCGEHKDVENILRELINDGRIKEHGLDKWFDKYPSFVYNFKSSNHNDDTPNLFTLQPTTVNQTKDAVPHVHIRRGVFRQDDKQNTIESVIKKLDEIKRQLEELRR